LELIYPAPLWRRLASASYDLLLAVALLLSGSLILVLVRDAAHLQIGLALWRAYYMVILFAFFGGFWMRGGQTLGMKAWRLQLRRDDGGRVLFLTALLRFLAAWLSWLLGGAGMLWCLVDRRRRAWHDIIAGTEVVTIPRGAPPLG
jgi:uncharacterized RDD family membrane protein YckC